MMGHVNLFHAIPFACILLPLAAAATTSVLPSRWANRVATAVMVLVTGLSAVFAGYMYSYHGTFTYMMGHFPAPWGNEIRAGVLEAITALFFSLILLLSAVGGRKKATSHIAPDKQGLYSVLLLLLLSALMVQVYTNDIFTAYVFLEIMTIAACSLITARSKGKTLVAAARYMIMNLVGSGLFLLGIILLYDLTGHLLMENLAVSVRATHVSGGYALPLTVVVGFISIGLGIKSALFPFHTWVPDAYSYTTPTSSAILSSLVSKGYIFLLIKIIVRVIGMDVVAATGIDDVLFVFAIAGMIMGSVTAIGQSDIRRMIAYSSVSQIGYVYMGIAMGNEAGMTAALFQIFSHALGKAMLFLAAGGLADMSGNSKDFRDLRGAGYRYPLGGVVFCIGALTMVGFPFLGGFIAKVYFGAAAMTMPSWQMVAVLLTMAISAALTTVYFLKTVITLYRPPLEGRAYPPVPGKGGFLFNMALVIFALANVALGVFSQPIVVAIAEGLRMFG